VLPYIKQTFQHFEDFYFVPYETMTVSRILRNSENVFISNRRRINACLTLIKVTGFDDVLQWRL
jgi:hypothetical protein